MATAAGYWRWRTRLPARFTASGCPRRSPRSAQPWSGATGLRIFPSLSPDRKETRPMSIKFQTNIPLLLHFPFGDAKENQGQYGVQYQYTVNHEHAQGHKDSLYATPTLHAHLSA